MNSYIKFLILTVINIILIKIIIKNAENFTDNYESILKKNDNNKLNTVKDDSNLFSQFCKKIKYFDDNYSNSSRKNIFNKFTKLDNLEKNRKKINDKLEEIFDLQEKIYFNKNDIAYFKKYEQVMSNTTKKYTEIIDKVINNLKSNLNSNIILNIK